jgi:hypothetical protein
MAILLVILNIMPTFVQRENMARALRLVYEIDNSKYKLLYEGFDKEEQAAYYDENPSKRYMVIEACNYTEQQCYKKTVSYLFNKHEQELGSEIADITRIKLWNNLRQEGFDD